MKLEKHIDDFEEWEVEATLIQEEDWIGLLKYRQERIKQYPTDLCTLDRYAEALILNKKYKEAIDFVTPLYQKYYEQGFGITQIIDALIGLGKTENDFNWLKKPTVFKLDKNTIDCCVKFIKWKKNFVRVSDFYDHLLDHADYFAFDEHELTNFLLMETNTFDFTGEKDIWGLKIKLKIK